MTEFHKSRPHRFVLQSLGPDAEVTLLWPAGSMGIIDTIDLCLNASDFTYGTVLINDVAVAQISLNGTTTRAIVETLLFPAAGIPVWEGDVIRCSVASDSTPNTVDFTIVGRVFGWSGPVPVTGLG